MFYNTLCYIFYVYLTLFVFECVSEKFQYISTEYPEVTYFNPKYLSFANLTARRYGRDDPFYYVGLHMNLLRPWDNNITVDFYFYEWLTNVYKRSFLEMHFTICDLVHKDKFFGPALKQGKFAKPCPYPPGAYNLYNMTVPVKYIPPHFPFKKGRIYCNLTSTDELLGSGHIDMEIKTFNRRKTKN